MELTTVLSKFNKAKQILSSQYKLDLPRIYNTRKELHKYPEIAFQEKQTKNRLIQYLKNHCHINESGIKNYAKTGFTYDIRGTASPQGTKKCIAFRADMDALPVAELNNFEYKSLNPNTMHACGHDGHMATLLGTAEILAKYQNLMPSNKSVRLVFQPGEEGGHGAEFMAKEGALENVDEIYALHSWSNPFGTFGIIKEGAMTTGMIRFRIDIHGVGTHGAYPENGKDPITAICQVHSALHTILSRGIGRKDYAVCTVGEIHAGNAENVIPDFATMGGSIRTHDKKVEEEIKKQMERIVKYTSDAFGCEGKVRYIEITPAIMNDKKKAADLRKVISDLFGEESVTEDTMGASEDFSFMTNKVPGAYMIVGHAVPGKEIIMNHNPRFDFNEELIAPAILTWVRLTENKFNVKLA